MVDCAALCAAAADDAYPATLKVTGGFPDALERLQASLVHQALHEVHDAAVRFEEAVIVPTNSLAEVSAALDTDPLDTQDAELLGYVMMLRTALANLTDMQQQMERRFPTLDDGQDRANEHGGS